jgi:hypothetical protein
MRSQDDELRTLKENVRKVMREVFTDGGQADATRMNMIVKNMVSTIRFDDAVKMFSVGDTWIAGTHKTNQRLLDAGVCSGYINKMKEIVTSSEEGAVKRGSFTIHSFQGLTIESGKVFVQTRSSTTVTYTLPAAAAGLTYTFVCGHANSEILITPAAGDAIVTKIHAAQDGTALAPAAGTGIKNTAATNVAGDSITLVCLDGTTWYGTSIVGLWASQ